MAPEILNGRNTERGLPREASDVYSICATIFNLLMGEEPWAEVVNAKIRGIHNAELRKFQNFGINSLFLRENH